MNGHGHESGRLNLPFVGIVTFGKHRSVAGRDRIEAEVAVQVLPNSLGFVFPIRSAG